MRLRTLPRKQRSPRRRTDRHPRDSLRKIHALRFKSIEVRSFYVGIAGESKCLRTPLIGNNKDDIRRPRYTALSPTAWQADRKTNIFRPMDKFSRYQIA